jgi:hypothetical protein
MTTALIFNLAVVLFGGTAAEHLSDNSCGPRAVSTVLDHYQLSSDTDDLVACLQNGNPMQPCSVNDIASHLTARGLTVKVVESTTVPISWPYPAVLFHKPRSLIEAQVGHFSAKLPVSDSHSQRSDSNGDADVVVILTAPSPIEFFMSWELRYGRVIPCCAWLLSSICICGVCHDALRRVFVFQKLRKDI